jgi:hypothetical protein
MARPSSSRRLLWASPQWQRFQDLAHKILNVPTTTSSCEEEELWTACLGDALDDVYSNVLMLTDDGNKGGEGQVSSSSPSHAAIVVQFLRNLCCAPTATTVEQGSLLQPPTTPPAAAFFRLRSFAAIRKDLTERSTSSTTAVVLRPVDIQWQVRLRLALWQCLGSQTFTMAWVRCMTRDLTPKQRRRLEKEKISPWEQCRQDITSLISLGHLQTGVSVQAFLVLCGLEQQKDSHSPSWKTRLVQEVWSFFDLLIDPNETGNAVPRRRPKQPSQPSAVLPPLSEEASVHTTQSTLPTSPSSSTITVATNNSKENNKTHAAYFGKRIQMTMPATKKTNTLLGKTARSRFMGSHFNTNMTNLPALFQTVSVPTMVRKKVLPPTRLGHDVDDDDQTMKKKTLPLKRQWDSTNTGTTIRRHKTVDVCETPVPPNRRRSKQSRVVWETPNDIRRPRMLHM